MLKKDSLIAQLLIYLSISFLFLFGVFITRNKPDIPATTFIVLLLITPMFMIDKPYFMAIELCTASAVFLIWMYGVKPYEVWRYDLINVVVFTVLGIFLHIIANSIRIKEFVLTREINEYLADESTDKGILLVMDVDRFKSINDTYGHDVGDSVISQLGGYLRSRFTHDEIIGRFGGDEFILFIRDTDDPDFARRIAEEVIKGTSENVILPDRDRKVSISIGIAVYHGAEKNYSEIFKKADTALYQSKADPDNRCYVYTESEPEP